MTKAHFLVPSVEPGEVVLAAEVSHHAIRVLRLRAGDPVSITDGRGALASGTLAVAEATGACIALESAGHVPRPEPRVTIAFALTKGSKPELVVEKLTELGVQRIVPWIAERSVVVWDEAKRQANGERFRRVAIGALEQSRRAWLPEALDPLPDLQGVLAAVAGDRLLVADVSATEPLAAAHAPTTVVIGPEGGFEPDELAAFQDAGAQLVSLSDATLRAETAAIAAATLARDHLARSAADAIIAAAGSLEFDEESLDRMDRADRARVERLLGERE